MALKNVKQVLKQAGRYDDILEVLVKIVNDDKLDYPVPAYPGKGGQICYRVDAKEVRREAASLLNYIVQTNSDEVHREMFNNLYHVIHGQTQMDLTNYAVAAMHRVTPESDLIERCRIWCTLQNLLDCMDLDEDDSTWTIPAGWFADNAYYEQQNNQSIREPKYTIGQVVVSLVEKRGSYEPSTCKKYEKMTIEKIARTRNNVFIYTCGYDGYELEENQIMSFAEYKEK